MCFEGSLIPTNLKTFFDKKPIILSQVKEPKVVGFLEKSQVNELQGKLSMVATNNRVSKANTVLECS